MEGKNILTMTLCLAQKVFRDRFTRQGTIIDKMILHTAAGSVDVPKTVKREFFEKKETMHIGFLY